MQRLFLVLVLAAAMSGCVSPVRKALVGPPPRSGAETCEELGGRIQRVCGGDAKACTVSYSDGGRPCSDSSECMGLCYVPDTRLISLPPGKNKGICQKTNVMCGCYSEVIRGVVQRAGHCAA
ncbi:MAG: hypothetical protein ACHQ49_03970 [Elusimicrobiota bacterium]